MHFKTMFATIGGTSCRTSEIGGGSSCMIFMKKSMFDFAEKGFFPVSM